MTRARVSALPIVVLLALAGALALSAGPAIGAGAHSAAVSSRTSSKKKAAPKPPARVSATVGIGDDSPGMFSNGQFKALHTRIARYVTPYDVIVHPNVDALGRLRQWLNAASRAGIQPLIAFYHSNVTPKRMPSVGTYTQDVKKFLRAFPQVRLLQPWDEANRGTVKEPGDSYTSPSAKQSAQYYLALSSACGRCTIVGLDVLDSTDVPATISYLNQFKRTSGASTCPGSGACTTTPTPTASTTPAPRRCSPTRPGRSGSPRPVASPSSQGTSPSTSRARQGDQLHVRALTALEADHASLRLSVDRRKRQA